MVVTQSYLSSSPSSIEEALAKAAVENDKVPTASAHRRVAGNTRYVDKKVGPVVRSPEEYGFPTAPSHGRLAGHTGRVKEKGWSYCPEPEGKYLDADGSKVIASLPAIMRDLGSLSVKKRKGSKKIATSCNVSVQV